MAKTENDALKSVEPAQAAQKYPLSEITANSEAAFGVKSEVIAGALYGADKSQYTHDEVVFLIDKFRKRKVD